MKLTRRHAGLMAVSTLLLPAVAPAARAAASAAEAFDALAERTFQARLDLDPLNGSGTTGDPRFEGKLEIMIAPDRVARVHALNRRALRELQAIPAERLDPARRLSRALLEDDLQLAIEGARWPFELMPIDQYGGMPVLLANLGGGDQFQPLKTPADHDNYLKRLAKLPQWNRQAIANMQQGIRRGWTVPRPLVESALPALRALAAKDFDASPYSTAAKGLPDTFPEAERRRLAAAYRTLFDTELQPSMTRLVAFVEDPYRAACRTTAGIGALPGGDALYRYLVRVQTTTQMTPQQIHQLGLDEVARIHGEMRSIQAEFARTDPAAGEARSIGEFLRWHEEAPRFRPFKSGAEIRERYLAIHAKVTPQLGRLFGRAPKLPLEVREMPELQRATGSDYYNPPSQDGSRPGTYFFLYRDPAQFNDAVMSTLYLHEGQPGHHYQIALQQELPLPSFRRYGYNMAFGEGWALYAETLGDELGLYADPNQRLGHLELELLRAVRLVTDTGLHAYGWSHAQTMRYMMDNQGIDEAFARSATERYMANPAQALAYKIGALRIQALRDRARAALGERFSLRDYHDLVLSEGTVPLRVLDRMVDDWIAARRARG